MATGARGHPLGTAVTQAADSMDTDDLDIVILDPDPAITATEAAAAMIPTGVSPDHSIDLHATTSHEIEAPVPTTAIVIHHTADNPPVGIHSEMTTDLAMEPEGNITNHPENLHGNPEIESTNKSQLTTHQQITTVQITAIGPQMMI